MTMMTWSLRPSIRDSENSTFDIGTERIEIEAIKSRGSLLWGFLGVENITCCRRPRRSCGIFSRLRCHRNKPKPSTFAASIDRELTFAAVQNFTSQTTLLSVVANDCLGTVASRSRSDRDFSIRRRIAALLAHTVSIKVEITTWGRRQLK